jgi:hypothetical protein
MQNTGRKRIVSSCIPCYTKKQKVRPFCCYTRFLDDGFEDIIAYIKTQKDV